MQSVKNQGSELNCEHKRNTFFWTISGDAALLEAAKKGNLGRVQKLATPENINCRDTQGRNSTPLHLAGKFQKKKIKKSADTGIAKTCFEEQNFTSFSHCAMLFRISVCTFTHVLACHTSGVGALHPNPLWCWTKFGFTLSFRSLVLSTGRFGINCPKKDSLLWFTAGYNNVEVAEFLLENGADVNAQDKGGLIPLHNASSYGVSNVDLICSTRKFWKKNTRKRRKKRAIPKCCCLSIRR